MESAKGSSDMPQSTAVQGYFVQLQSIDTDSEFSLLGLIHVLREYRAMIFAIVFSLTVVSIAISLIMRPVYRSVVLMAPTSVEGTQSSLAALAGQFGLGSLGGLDGGGAAQTAEAVAILKSRTFTKRFIDNENLLPILFSDEWDTELNRWDVDDPSEIPTDEDAFRLFNDKVRAINPVKRTDMLTLSIEWFDRDLAALWANKLVSELNNYMRNRDIAEAEKSIEFLNTELANSTSLELRQGISSLIERQIEVKMLANVRDQYAFKVLDPAVVADENKRVRPKRKIIVISTFIAASILAIFLALVRFQFRSSVTTRDNDQ